MRAFQTRTDTYTREEGCFHNAEEETHSYEATETGDAGRCSGNARPDQDATRQIDARSYPGEDHVRRKLGQHVADVEDRHRNVELVIDKTDVCFKVVQASLAGHCQPHGSQGKVGGSWLRTQYCSGPGN